MVESDRGRLIGIRRSRAIYGGLIAITVLLGLGSRTFAQFVPLLLKKRAGDALWAAAVFFALVFLFRQVRTGSAAAVAFSVSVIVEFSQLIHIPWLDRVRSHGMGHLLLGSGFAWNDIPSYACGILVAAGIDFIACRVGINRRGGTSRRTEAYR